MEPLEAAQAYFDAWNLQDPAEIAATFAPGGTYADPTTGQPLGGTSHRRIYQRARLRLSGSVVRDSKHRSCRRWYGGGSVADAGHKLRTFWRRTSHRPDGRIAGGRLHCG